MPQAKSPDAVSLCGMEPMVHTWKHRKILLGRINTRYGDQARAEEQQCGLDAELASFLSSWGHTLPMTFMAFSFPCCLSVFLIQTC